MRFTIISSHVIPWKSLFLSRTRILCSINARNFSFTAKCRLVVLGIESSCDDTGAAVVDDNGHVLGDALRSQTKTSVQMGGVIPQISRYYHSVNIGPVVSEALHKADMRLEDVDAIATAVKPGNIACLDVGYEYTKQLLQKVHKPFIPIHHMEAHALTVRMMQQLDFPFLVLLMSGGHCLLAVAKDVTDFLLLGSNLDSAPGDVLDKVARRMKLRNLPHYDTMSGGRAVEHLASTCGGDVHAFAPCDIKHNRRDCNFSFSGILARYLKLIGCEEQRLGVRGGNVLPNAADVCASLQYNMALHLTNKLCRALLYCDVEEIFAGRQKTLVLSGGVASNEFMRSCIRNVCAAYDCDVICPLPHLCTDNGIMIAWNGVEKLRRGIDVETNIDDVTVKHRAPLGEDISEDIASYRLPSKRIDML